MQLVSLLGLVVILGTCWALSRARGEVVWRPVLWGLGLQFLLALVILRDDVWGRAGMVAFAALLLLYGARREAGLGWRSSARVVALSQAEGVTLLSYREGGEWEEQARDDDHAGQQDGHEPAESGSRVQAAKHLDAGYPAAIGLAAVLCTPAAVAQGSGDTAAERAWSPAAPGN